MFYYKLIFLSLLTLSLSACATTTHPPTQSSAIAISLPETATEYTVKPGETLWRICKLYNTDLENVLRLNKFSDSQIIIPGQKIILPKTQSKNSEPQTNFTSKDESDFIWPIKGRVITQFKQKRDGVLSKGIDISAEPKENIFASRNGKVAFIGTLAGYGKMLIINHYDGLSSVYCGIDSINVNTEDEIKQGTVIAKASDYPRNGSSSLHFEIRKKHKPQNPLYYLN